ncbi:copper resistance CopC family protein [Nitrosospira sp. NpAV]|uniref:copper resistance CopC family protein n=1 Tax=Nitrosospira sp. NpAV TaxID=58133 RepID=UPI0005A1F692|nr:copper resistance CopC family protein [Nitrosospira sp. NpAV]KIO47808.1 copper-binding protein [Nitrosospira sp. NpAV]
MKAWMVCALKRVMAGSALIMAMAAGLHSAPVLAHAMLVKAEPPRRAVLTVTPTQVRLWFNEEIEKDYAALSVLDAAKAPVTEAKPTIAPDDPRAIVLALPGELAAGKYTVKFRVLSVDGHVVDSSYDFTVKSKAQAK